MFSIIGFVVFLTFVMIYCVDYEKLMSVVPSTDYKSLWDFVSFKKLGSLPFFPSICLFSFVVFWFLQLSFILSQIPNLMNVYRFFTDLLEIKDSELSTLELQVVINKIVALQEEHRISVDRLNAFDIANRIMRKENFLIALFNKDILDTTIPIPLPYFKDRYILTKLLEWNISFCIINYVFDEKYAVKETFLKETQRDSLAAGLQKRFIMLGIINIILAPFIALLLIIYYILRYGEEIYQNPSAVGARQYTPLAKWKMREFNELPHLFNRRLANSYRKAKKYMDQFHNDKLAALGKFVAFIAGSFLVILVGLSIFNEELLLRYEITSGRTILYYIGFFGIILAASKSVIPDENATFEPVPTFHEVVQYTHYLPAHWRGKLHTEKVNMQFGNLFQLKMKVLLHELLGVTVTPFILAFSLANCSGEIIDFFREFTVHVDGIGYVCSFALFDFNRHGNPRYGAMNDRTDKYQRSKQGKMEKSFLSFKNAFPNWEPSEQGSVYLQRVKESVTENQSSETSLAPTEDQSNIKVPVDWEFDSFYKK